jgi:long-chain acyl-CoA synthetase
MAYDFSTTLELDRYSSLVDLIEQASVRYGDKMAFFKTVDMAVLTPDGNHKIVDRKKDMIIVSGFNVYPNEVENVLASHSAIMECAVIGVEDDHSGEAVKAVLVLEAAVMGDHQQLTADIDAYCRQQLAAYKVPRYIEIVEALPKSAVGKVRRRELRQASC